LAERERDCSRRGTAAHPSLTLGAALCASNFAPQSCRTHGCFMFSGSNPAMAAAHPDGSRFEESAVKSGGREGFIPLPEVHELKRFSNIPEYPYLRKYPHTEWPRSLNNWSTPRLASSNILARQDEAFLVHDGRGASTMIAMPTSAIPAPAKSHNVGR
jgi:hypothetical protein